MAEIPIDSDILRPGDLVEIVYLVKARQETLIALAVHNIKQTVAADQRFDYQSGKREYRTDLETGITYEYLVVQVILRSERKGDRIPIQEAHAGTLVAGLIGVAAAYAAVIAYHTYATKHVATRKLDVAEKILDSDAPDHVKQAAYEAMGSSTDLGVDLFGSKGLMPWLIAGGLVAGMYLASKSRREF